MQAHLPLPLLLQTEGVRCACVERAIGVIVLIAFADLGSVSVSPFGNSPSISALFFIMIFAAWSVIGAGRSDGGSQVLAVKCL